jgi:energy-coupling factor transport system ATP-binding protein
VRAVFADAPRLASLGLGLPQVTQCAHRLRERGLPVRPDVLTVEEAQAAILDALAAKSRGIS